MTIANDFVREAAERQLVEALLAVKAAEDGGLVSSDPTLAYAVRMGLASETLEHPTEGYAVNPRRRYTLTAGGLVFLAKRTA